MEEIVKTLNDLNTSTVVDGGGDSSDTAWWLTERKVPGVELYSANENYFFFHHSHGIAFYLVLLCPATLYFLLKVQEPKAVGLNQARSLTGVLVEI